MEYISLFPEGDETARGIVDRALAENDGELSVGKAIEMLVKRFSYPLKARVFTEGEIEKDSRLKHLEDLYPYNFEKGIVYPKR